MWPHPANMWMRGEVGTIIATTRYNSITRHCRTYTCGVAATATHTLPDFHRYQPCVCYGIERRSLLQRWSGSLHHRTAGDDTQHSCGGGHPTESGMPVETHLREMNRSPRGASSHRSSRGAC